MNPTQREVMVYLVDQMKKLEASRDEPGHDQRWHDALEGQINAVTHIWGWFGRMWVG